MNYSAYPTPPPGYHAPNLDSFHRGTTPMTPMSPAPGYYSPRYNPNQTPSPRDSPKMQAHGHARRATQVPGNHYASPRGAAFARDIPSSRFPATPAASARPEFVSGDFGRFHSAYGYCHDQGHANDYPHRPRARREKDVSPLKGSSHRERKRRPSQTAKAYTRVVYHGADLKYNDYYDSYDYIYDHAPPPYQQYEPHVYREPHTRTWRFDMYGNADYYARHQVPIFESSAETKPTRTRRASHAARAQPKPQPPKRPEPAAPKVHAKATEEDARRAGIPAGYSYKNWDPTEEPIMLLGSVFDANSLGKWIYDWTVFYHGSATPLSEMAGELWLLLIQLAGKVKRAEESMPKIRKQQSRELVEDFLESGERLWIRFAKLLKVCEDYMWKAAKKETGEKKPAAMGKNSGCEFVNSIFGRDRELEKTEKLMTGMRLWSMRFDANCNEILRHPGA